MSGPGGAFLEEPAGSLPGRYFAALARAETYAVSSNPYFLYGFLWGIPVPVSTVGVAIGAGGCEGSVSGVIRCILDNPWQWFFLAHPLLFGVVFGALGTLARDRDRRIEALTEELRRRADTDGLTGLLNQRAFYERCAAEIARAGRAGVPLSLLILDLDHFKAFNDRHGHLAGDQALAAFAQALKTFVRSYDAVARYGGEEFAVILPGMARAEARAAADRFRQALHGLELSLPGLPRPVLTVSIGVAQWRPDEAPRDWLSRADRRLYAAKTSGRDRVCAEDADPVNQGGASG